MGQAHTTRDAGIEAIVRDVAQSLLKGVRVVSVIAERGFDSDGDDVVRITVVYDAKAPLNAAAVASMVRRLLPKLEAAAVEGFPLMSFVAKKEARELELALAPRAGCNGAINSRRSP